MEKRDAVHYTPLCFRPRDYENGVTKIGGIGMQRAINEPSKVNEKALGPGALNGKRYIESLRDGREVWVAGERVKDVTAHPVFAGMCREMARIYDLQHAPETIDQITS